MLRTAAGEVTWVGEANAGHPSPVQRRRLALPPLLRIVLMLLLSALLTLVLRPPVPPPEALAAAGEYLAQEYAGYTFELPPRSLCLLGNCTLTYTTSHQGEYARVSLEVSRRDGQYVVVSSSLGIGRADGGQIVRFAVSVLLVLGLIVLVFFVSVPRTFGRKCPRDLCLLTVTEETVVPSRIEKSGLGLAPIIERIYRCPKCDFEHHEALFDPSFRPWSALPHLSSQETNERRLANAITVQDHARLLADAKAAALAASSSDSPWLYR